MPCVLFWGNIIFLSLVRLFHLSLSPLSTQPIPTHLALRLRIHVSMKLLNNLNCAFRLPSLYAFPITYSFSYNIVPFWCSCLTRVFLQFLGTKAFYPTGDFPCHNEKELSRIFEAKESTSFSSKCQILTMDNESNKVTGNFYAGQRFGFFGDLPRGPRGNRRSRDLSSFSSSSSSSSSNPLVNRDKYNLPDFQIKYEQAKFFVIKSFTEEDIHRSIKYNVWASTSTGNRKLDCAFRDAEARLHDGVKCHVFLFFSVGVLLN